VRWRRGLEIDLDPSSLSHLSLTPILSGPHVAGVMDDTDTTSTLEPGMDRESNASDPYVYALWGSWTPLLRRKSGLDGTSSED
jgi:hypothetical protein